MIHPSSSPWANPVVLVRKKEGSLRFYIDYCDLNSIIKSDIFLLPRVDDILDELGRSKFFSTLDLGARYWQVQVHPDLCEKTAFITHHRLYQFFYALRTKERPSCISETHAEDFDGPESRGTQFCIGLL